MILLFNVNNFLQLNFERMADIDHLFETKPVAELVQLRNDNALKISSSQNELRQLVAEKYRDLLHVADNIIDMNTIVTESNLKLSQLAFTKSNYTSKYVNNLNSSRRFNRQVRINEVKSSNGDTILNNLIHELNYSLLKLKNGTVTNNSEHYVRLAKHCFLIQYIFKSNINSNPNDFPVIKFKQLKSEFIELIHSQIKSIETDFDVNFYLNLLISHVLITMNSPLDSIVWAFHLRLQHLQLHSPNWSFNKLLTYSFLSFQMVTVSNQKLNVLLSRQISNSSHWLEQTSFQNWLKWLNLSKLKLEFPASMTAPFKIEESLTEQWGVKIGKLFKTHYDNQIALDDDKVSTGIKYLTNFKNFTSITNLKFNDDDSIITYILSSLESNLISYINTRLGHLTQNCELILNNFENLEYIKSIRTKSGLNLFQDFSLNELIESFNQPEEVNEFQTNTDAIIQSIESVKKLAKNIQKPIISIDDTEDDEFWFEISAKLNKGVVDQAISQCNKSLKGTFITFLSNINEKFHSPNENIQWLYLIRSLIKFEFNFNIGEFQNSLSIINPRDIVKLDINEGVHGCILKSFNKVFDSLFDTYSEKIIQGYTLESNLYGISIEGIILDMISQLKRPLNQEDFSDVFESQVSIDIQDDFLEKLSAGMKEHLSTQLNNISEDDGLTLYSNCVFIECMKSPNAVKNASDEVIEILKTKQDGFEDDEKLQMIKKSIGEHFHNERIIFSPFCS